MLTCWYRWVPGPSLTSRWILFHDFANATRVRHNRLGPRNRQIDSAAYINPSEYLLIISFAWTTHFSPLRHQVQEVDTFQYLLGLWSSVIIMMKPRLSPTIVRDQPHVVSRNFLQPPKKEDIAHFSANVDSQAWFFVISTLTYNQGTILFIKSISMHNLLPFGQSNWFTTSGGWYTSR